MDRSVRSTSRPVMQKREIKTVFFRKGTVEHNCRRRGWEIDPYAIPIWCNVSFQSMICLLATRVVESPTSNPCLLLVELICVPEVASSNTKGSLTGKPSSVIIGAVMILPLPTWESISLHSSFHLAYCILLLMPNLGELAQIKTKKQLLFVAIERGYLLLCLICSRSSNVLAGSKQPSKNSQTSPLIAGCTPWQREKEREMIHIHTEDNGRCWVD